MRSPKRSFSSVPPLTAESGSICVTTTFPTRAWIRPARPTDLADVPVVWTVGQECVTSANLLTTPGELTCSYPIPSPPRHAM